MESIPPEKLRTFVHDARNPLHTIVGYSGCLLERAFGPISPKQEQCLRDILDAANELKRLTEQLTRSDRPEDSPRAR